MNGLMSEGERDARAIGGMRRRAKKEKEGGSIVGERWAKRKREEDESGRTRGGRVWLLPFPTTRAKNLRCGQRRKLIRPLLFKEVKIIHQAEKRGSSLERSRLVAVSLCVRFSRRPLRNNGGSIHQESFLLPLSPPLMLERSSSTIRTRLVRLQRFSPSFSSLLPLSSKPSLHKKCLARSSSTQPKKIPSLLGKTPSLLFLVRCTREPTGYSREGKQSS